MQSTRSQAISIPRTLDQLHDIVRSDIPRTIQLVQQYPSVANLITFDYFCEAAWTGDLGMLLVFAKLPMMANLIDSEDKFKQICNANFEVAVQLLSHPKIAKIAQPLIPFMPHYYLQLDKSKIKKKILSESSMAALDLAQAYDKKEVTDIDEVKSYARTLPVSDRMTLDEFNEEKAAKAIFRTFPSVKKYCDLMMYGPSGYYATGKVDFLNHFQTFASDGNEVPGFSAAMAYQLFHIRNNLIEGGKLTPHESFNVLECGGGNGDLCFNILETISKMAKESSEWKEFFLSMRYHLVEVSPELVKRQRQRNQKFSSWVKVIEGSALTLIDELANTKMAAVFSNELVDMFAPQEVCLDENDNVIMSFMVPYIPVKHLEATAEHDNLSISEFQMLQAQYFVTHNAYFIQAMQSCGLSLEKLIADSQRYKELYCLFVPEEQKKQVKQNIEKLLLLSQSSFLKLHKITAQEKQCPNLFNFIIARTVNAEYDKELSEFLKRNPQYTDRMRTRRMRYVDIGIHDYLQSMYNLMMTDGEIITIDYGDNDYQVMEYLRTFSANRTMDAEIRSEPGFKDITKFVNFSTLAQEGQQLNLEPVFYGMQKQLNNDNIPSTVLNPTLAMYYKVACEHRNGFRVMVQRKQEQEEKVNPSHETSSRFTGTGLLVTHTQLFSNMQQKVKMLKQERQAIIDALVTKYNLPDQSQESLEKGLRNAANLGRVQDLKLFIQIGTNVNAKDKGTNGYTALHLAALKKHTRCYQLLIEADANPYIPDNHGQTAYAIQFASAINNNNDNAPRRNKMG